MSKAVLISIKPEWCELIANGNKTIEVRKTKPKLEMPFKCYIYESGGNQRVGNENFNVCLKGKGRKKVIGEFVCDKITELAPINRSPDDVEERACLTRREIVRYLKGRGYAWHISDLVIYDEPKMLHNFFKPCGDCDKKGTKRCTEELTYCRAKTITRPPQSWCYVEEVS